MANVGSAGKLSLSIAASKQFQTGLAYCAVWGQYRQIIVLVKKAGSFGGGRLPQAPWISGRLFIL
jgi:hypothetical protein